MGIQQLLSVKPLKNLYFESVLEAGALLPFVLHGTGQMQPSHSSRADRAHIIAQFGQAELEPLEVGFKTTGIQFFVHGLKSRSPARETPPLKMMMLGLIKWIAEVMPMPNIRPAIS